METRFERDKAAAEQVAQQEANLTVYTNWLAKSHPEIRDCDANRGLFREYMSWDDEQTPADFEFALSNMGNRLVLQDVPTPEETKAELISEICSLLQSPDGTGREGKRSDFDLKTVRTQMQFWDVPKLQARRDEIFRAQQMVKQPISELKQIVRSARKYVGYPQLGKSVVPPGKVRSVPLDAAYLRGLDVWELKKFCRLYGAEQVNARLRGGE